MALVSQLVAESSLRRFGRALQRGAGAPTERDWERSALLEPRVVPAHPELISDGSGLPFAPSALVGAGDELDPDDGAVAALVAQLARSAAKAASRSQGRAKAPAQPSLAGWRVLARAKGEVLFGRGAPSRLTTVTVRPEGWRGKWRCVTVSQGRPLRATRDGIRASGWRLEPSHEPGPEDTVLRVLVTEQTWSGAERADKRLLPPDLYVDAENFVLTMFVTPRGGFQVRTPNPETPARVVLPHPVGARGLIDGALYEREPAGAD